MAMSVGTGLFLRKWAYGLGWLVLAVVGSKTLLRFFLYLFYHDFAKIHGRPEILQNYTSAAVAHGVRDITSWPTAV
jgi:hypothetical protein